MYKIMATILQLVLYCFSSPLGLMRADDLNNSGHNWLGPAGERRSAFRSQLVDAALNTDEPAVNVAQENIGSVGDRRTDFGGAARAFRELGGAGERLLPISRHNWHLGRSPESGITYPAAMLLDQPSAALGVLAGTPWFRLNKHFDRPGGRYPE